jgi:hypothetical protein
MVFSRDKKNLPEETFVMLDFDKASWYARLAGPGHIKKKKEMSMPKTGCSCAPASE